MLLCQRPPKRLYSTQRAGRDGEAGCLAGKKAMQYIYSPPSLTSFDEKGRSGYKFGPLKQQDLEIYYIHVKKERDTFTISQPITQIYYVLSGSGYFIIDTCKYEVSTDMLVEVPPKVQHSYYGKMKLIAVSKLRWFVGNSTHTKCNPDFLKGNWRSARDHGGWLLRSVKITVFGKSPINAYLRLNRRLWTGLPPSATALRPIRAYGYFLHKLVRLQSERGQLPHTFFLRNRPALELLKRMVERRARGETLKIAVLGCSAGAEAYSVAWRIRSARPDLKLVLEAVDISEQAIQVAKRGVYSPAVLPITGTNFLDRMTEAEIEELFDKIGDELIVKAWIQEGIRWHVGDVGEPEVLDVLGVQDIVVANNFLCHMDDWAAERCLRNIARLISPDGYIFVSGIDLDIRTRIAKDLRWEPVQELLEEIHYGDPRMAVGWPWNYSSLEPLNKKRRDWGSRYATAFQTVSGERTSNSEANPPWGCVEGSVTAYCACEPTNTAPK